MFQSDTAAELPIQLLPNDTELVFVPVAHVRYAFASPRPSLRQQSLKIGAGIRYLLLKPRANSTDSQEAIILFNAQKHGLASIKYMAYGSEDVSFVARPLHLTLSL